MPILEQPAGVSRDADALSIEERASEIIMLLSAVVLVERRELWH